MSVLVLGLNHRSAPVSVLERAALDADSVGKLLADTAGTGYVTEVLAIATCNRIELYADVAKFHPAFADLSELLAVHTGVPIDELRPHLYVHYEERAVHHLYRVACGLDSMVVGEPQVLGQLRSALAAGRAAGTVGRVLDHLGQQALRVGKRAHSETDLDRAGQSLVTVALEEAERTVGPVAGRAVLVVGAGSMSALAAATLRRRDVGRLLIANRTKDHAVRLAGSVDGTVVDFADFASALPDVDLVISCTGATGTVIGVEDVAEALTERAAGKRLVFLDLALPRDVAPAVRDLPGVDVIDLERIAEVLAGDARATDVDAVRQIIAEEVAGYLAGQRALEVAPTVTALRSKGAEVVDAELTRLDGRLPGLDERTRAEISRTMHRIVDKLLHAPTVRVKELAGEPGAGSYADALRELFDLDPKAVEAVSRADVTDVTEAGEAADPGDDGEVPR